MADTELLNVEETSNSPQTAPAAEAPAAPETSMKPDREQQSVLDTIRDASTRAGGFELQNGKVVVKAEPKPETPAGEVRTAAQAPTEQSTEFEDLVINGEAVRVPKSELKNLAQQGYRFTQKTQELAAERRQVEEMKAAALAIVAQQAGNSTAQAELSDEENINLALAEVKERFGKEDDSFEYDPLDLKQQAHFARALNKLDSKLERQQSQREQAARSQQESMSRNEAWEATQRANDPEYNDTIAWALEKIGDDKAPRLKKLLSAADFDALDVAYRTGDTATIGKTMTIVKKAYQGQKLGLPTRQPVNPPRVQSPGNGAAPVRQEAKGDPKQLGTMTHDQKRAWIREEMVKRSKGT